MAEEKIVKLSNPRLRGAMQALMVQNDVRHRMVVLEELLNSRFLCPFVSSQAPVMDENGEPSFPEGSQFRPYVYFDRQGEPRMLAFTDEEALNNWKHMNKMDQTFSYLCSLGDFANIMLNYPEEEKKNMPNGFIINLADEDLLVDKDMIANLITRVYVNETEK